MPNKPAGPPGHLETLPSGQIRLRVRHAGRRVTVGLYDDPDAAQRAQLELALGKRLDTTVAGFGESWLKSLQGEKGRPDPRAGALKIIQRAPFAGHQLDAVRRGDLTRWFRELGDGTIVSRKTGRPYAPATRRWVASTLQSVWQLAVDEELVQANLAGNLRVTTPRGAPKPWSYLTPQQQQLLCRAEVRPELILPVRVAMGTGLRQGELFALELADVHLEDRYLLVQYGGRGRAPTKSGKTRQVPLFGDALEAMLAWLDFLPSWTHHPERSRGGNPLALVFPTRTGRYRSRSKPLGFVRENGRKVNLWKEVLAHVFGESFRFRWHDLRHTAAASLISGWWTRDPWRLEHVRDFLGHRSVKVAEMYAHLAPDYLRQLPLLTGVDGLAHAGPRPPETAAPPASPKRTPQQVIVGARLRLVGRS